MAKYSLKYSLQMLLAAYFWNRYIYKDQTSVNMKRLSCFRLASGVQVLTIANPAHRMLKPLKSKGASSDKNQAKKETKIMTFYSNFRLWEQLWDAYYISSMTVNWKKGTCQRSKCKWSYNTGRKAYSSNATLS